MFPVQKSPFARFYSDYGLTVSHISISMQEAYILPGRVLACYHGMLKIRQRSIRIQSRTFGEVYAEQL